MRYRPEIDGLRAVAVISVILFHAGFAGFSGGFVGVDIFFVISGYLITTIILSELEGGRFSIARFYERRARRILPALFLVLLTCLPFAWVWLSPSDMKLFAQSLAAVPVFLSNVVFWRTSGYFDTANELKPLLHTWSLGVEEQYYVIFPLLLMIVWKIGRRWLWVSLIATAVVSLTWAQILLIAKPAATFYLLPTRSWELIVGALVALYFSTRDKHQFSEMVASFGAASGLFLIILAIVFFNKETPFPGIWALVPTVGAVLIILFADAQNIVGKLLRSKPFVGIGLISYSTYLWHQPLFAFAKHISVQRPSDALLASLAAFSLLLAYFSWRFVEAPFRTGNHFSRKAVFKFSFLGSFFFVVFGSMGYVTNGFERRVSREQAEFLQSFENSVPLWKFFSRTGIPEEFHMQCDFYDIEKYRSGYSSRIPVDHIASECYRRIKNSGDTLFIWGDSHAQQLYPGLKREMPPGWQILQVASSGCEPILGAVSSTIDYCEQSNWFAYKAILEVQPDVVVIAQNINHDAATMLRLSQQLHSVGVKKVVFVGPSPHWSTELPKIVAFRLWADKPHKTLVGIDESVTQLNLRIKATFKQTESTRFVSLIDYFCDRSGCDVFYGDSVKDGITSWDLGHLTPIASQYLARDVLVRQILE